MESLIGRGRYLIKEYKEVRYIIAGTVSELIEYFSFIAIFELTHANHLYISNSISYLLGVVSGFIFHKYWSFAGDQQLKTHHQMFSYIGLAGFNFVLVNIEIGAYVKDFHLAPYIAKFLAIAVTALWSFVLTNYVIFRHHKPIDESAKN